MSPSLTVDSPPPLVITDPQISIQNLSFAYGGNQALFDINLDVARNRITALIGPSGCGKSTLLRSLNRISDLVNNARITQGRILFEGHDIHNSQIDVIRLRRKIGMVFQKYNPFPRSIFENVAYGLEVAGVTPKKLVTETVEQSLRAAALWDEVKDRLHESALGLSGGQQQRLCIARTLCVKPQVILMDEPCAALDPIATAKIEELITELKKSYTIVIVTHNMEQAVRVSDHTAFFYHGRLIEYDDTMRLFSTPSHPQTAKYISGRMG